MLGRTRIHTRARGSGAGAAGATLLAQATAYLNGIAPYHWFDFVNDRCLYASNDVGGVSGATGYSFSRASTGYYTNADGTLTSFASGALRRGDRGVLIEGARTNLLLRSQEFDNASWTKAGASVTANSIAAPDGTLTADLVTATTTGTAGVAQTVLGTAAAYSFSVYAKAGTSNWLRFVTNDGTTNVTTWFNLSNGTIGTNGVGHTSQIIALANGWYRCRVIRTMAAAGANMTLRLVDADNSATGTIGTTQYWWGAQAELGSGASSYIPTTTASATRAADVLTFTAGVSYPLSLWAEFERSLDTGATERVLSISDGTATNRAQLSVNSPSTGVVSSVAGGVSQSTISLGTVNLFAVAKMAGSFDTNDVNAALNGTAGIQDTSATNPAAPSVIGVGISTASTEHLNGYIRRLAIFNSALSAAGLQTVTA